MTATRTFFAATLALTAVTASAALPAQAEPAGPACCADLDRRVAELEAATGKKDGTVSLAITGEVNGALLIWEKAAAESALGAAAANAAEPFLTDALLASSRRSGFVVELGFTESAASAQAEEAGEGSAFRTRLANWYVEGERTAPQPRRPRAAAAASATIDLSRPQTYPVTWHGPSFGLREETEDYTGLIWGDVAWRADGL